MESEHTQISDEHIEWEKSSSWASNMKEVDT